MEITVYADTNPNAWSDTGKCDEETAAKAATILVAKMAAGMREAYPDAEVRTETRWYNDGETVKLVTVSGLGGDVETWEQIQGEALHLQTAHAYDALSEAIAETQA